MDDLQIQLALALGSVAVKEEKQDNSPTKSPRMAPAVPDGELPEESPPAEGSAGDKGKKPRILTRREALLI